MSAPLTVSDALFGKTRQAVLALLFGNPGRTYYIREIVHAAGGGASQVQRELDRLTRSGLLTRERRGNQVHFQANPGAAVFAELSGLVTKSFGIADVLRRALQPSSARMPAAFIYGSVARNEHHAASDVDVLIVGDVLLSDLDDTLREAEKRLGRTVSITLLDPEEYRTRHRANDHFLRAIMAGPKIFLVGDDATLASLNDHGAR